MALVHIRLNNREYDIACDDGQEEHLRSLARELDERIKTLNRAMGTAPGDNMALILTALTMADELLEHKKENRKISNEIKRLSSVVNEDQKLEQQERMFEMEQAMAVTLEEIAQRIEKIANQVEVG